MVRKSCTSYDVFWKHVIFLKINWCFHHLVGSDKMAGHHKSSTIYLLHKLEQWDGNRYKQKTKSSTLNRENSPSNRKETSSCNISMFGFNMSILPGVYKIWKRQDIEETSHAVRQATIGSIGFLMIHIFLLEIKQAQSTYSSPGNTQLKQKRWGCWGCWGVFELRMLRRFQGDVQLFIFFPRCGLLLLKTHT